MNEQHLMQPTPDEISVFVDKAYELHYSTYRNEAITSISIRLAYAAGADAELDSCCDWLRSNGLYETRIGHLRAARRPKPPTLKERALEVLDRVSKDQYPCNYQADEDWETIRKALELLPDEAQ